MSRRDALRISAAVGVVAGAGGLLGHDLVRRLGLHRVEHTRTQMGTAVTISVVHPEEDAAKAMVGGAFTEMERLEGILTRHRPESALSQLNRVGRLGEAPGELVHVVESGIGIGELTEGAFDITVAPLLALYGAHFAANGHGPDALAPPATEIAEALRLVDYRGIRVDGRGISLPDSRMAITLDGIAKGFIVDGTVATMTAAGAERVLVNAGGDMLGGGRTVGHEPWRIGIEDPARRGRPLDVVDLGEQSIATSGDYMRAFTTDRRHHHIVDPRTGYSPPETSGATVIAPDALSADALSTALLVQGASGLEMIERRSDVHAMVVTKDGTVTRSRGFPSAA